MVYLDELIQKKKEEILEEDSLASYCYWFIKNHQNLDLQIPESFADEEILAAKGYKGIEVDEEEIKNLLEKKPVKNLDFTSNIYKLLGTYLLSQDLLRSKVDEKFATSNLKSKYLVSKIDSTFREKLQNDLRENSDLEDKYEVLLKYVVSDVELIDVSSEVTEFNCDDVIDLLLLEEIRKTSLAKSIFTKFKNLSAIEIIRQVLKEFGNSVKKITQNRRKGHDEFKINDEYDVQDLLYVILKPLFPKLIDEDPNQKVGGVSNKIDLIIREEKILIEVKMIKESDTNEKKFIEELKIDFESYHSNPHLEFLFAYIYDPQNKTKDIQNFYQLNGIREKNGKSFEVEIIVGN